MTRATYEASVEKVFPRGTHVTSRRQRSGAATYDITIPCTEGHDVVETIEKRIPPDGLRGNLARKGWLFKGSKATCPEHMKKEDKPVTEKKSGSTRVSTLKPGASRAGCPTRRSPMKSVSPRRLSPISAKSSSRPMKEPAEFAKFRERMDGLEREANAFGQATSEGVAEIIKKIEALRADVAAVSKRNGW